MFANVTKVFGITKDILIKKQNTCLIVDVLKKVLSLVFQKIREMSGNRRLRRNINDKVIGGVCSGLADYFNIDTTLVRAILASSIIFAGVGLGLYIVLWIVLPTE